MLPLHFLSATELRENSRLCISTGDYTCTPLRDRSGRLAHFDRIHGMLQGAVPGTVSGTFQQSTASGMALAHRHHNLSFFFTILPTLVRHHQREIKPVDQYRYAARYRPLTGLPTVPVQAN